MQNELSDGPQKWEDEYDNVVPSYRIYLTFVDDRKRT